MVTASEWAFRMNYLRVDNVLNMLLKENNQQQCEVMQLDVKQKLLQSTQSWLFFILQNTPVLFLSYPNKFSNS